MTKLTFQKYWHKIFKLSIILKGINGTWETISGVFVLLFSKATLNAWFLSAVHKELLEDPNDTVINLLIRSFENSHNDTKTFVAAYILFHGFLNLFLAVQLYRDKHWAYFMAIGTLSLFATYQIYRIAIYHSPILVVFTIFDIIFIALTWYEYRHHKEIKE